MCAGTNRVKNQDSSLCRLGWTRALEKMQNPCNLILYHCWTVIDELSLKSPFGQTLP